MACARVAVDGGARHDVKTFAATTTALFELSDWLTEHGCTHVAMEATGVYWKPVWHILEEGFELILANATHIKNVPGRKTDVSDAMWIADLLAHGLIRASFVPENAIQDLRGLTRTRKQLVREKTQHVQRIQKTLEDANLKLSSVISSVVGGSGRAILEALIKGQTNPEKLVELTHRLQASRETLIEALTGRVTKHHRFLLKLHLDQVKALEKSIARVEKEVASTLGPFRAAAELLTTMPGISDTVAQVVVSEVGVDMSRFPTPGNLISWAGLCPRNDESAGKRRSNRLRQGAPWLKTVLVQAAWAAVRTHGSYLRAQYHRIKSRRGAQKAIMAVAASMLKSCYFMLRDSVPYRDLGADYFDKLDKDAAIARLVRRLNRLGCEVEVKPAA